MRLFASLRMRGTVWTLSALLVGLAAAWLWLSSQAAWKNYLNRAFITGLAVYDTLRDGTLRPDGVSIDSLSPAQARIAQFGEFTRLADVPVSAFVTNVSIRSNFPDELSGPVLSLAIVSPELRYPVASISSQGGNSPAIVFASLTRLVASYCSTPMIYARYGSGDWVVIDGTPVWGCAAAPYDLRLPAVLLVVLYLAAALPQVAETSGQLRAFASALGNRRRTGGPQTYDVEGPEEMREIVGAVNTYLEQERDLLAKRAMVLSGVSHDLGTPATRLRLRTALIEDDELRGKLEADIDRMTGMIESVLTYTRSELNTETPRRLSLASLVESVVADYRDVGKPVTMAEACHTEVETRRSVFASTLKNRKIALPEAHPILVTARPLSLQRAISNLIDNALKYGRRATVSLTATSSEAAISVEDEGSSLGEEELSNLTAPFRRGRNTQSIAGVGLGLTIVNTIAEQHGGTLAFENTGRGLRAVLRITRE